MPAGHPLSAEQVAEITIRYSAGESVTSIAESFGISPQSVSVVARRGGATIRARGQRDNVPRSAIVPCGWIVASSDGEMVSGWLHRTEEEGRRALASKNAKLELAGCSPAALFGLVPITTSNAGAHREHADGVA